MSYDGMVTHCVVSELNQQILNGKIDKIYQPEREEIILVIRTLNGTQKLLLSASPANPRVHLTSSSKENPMTPPMLCMLMRKHLTGSKIVGITQLGFDRVIRLDMETRNELGDLCTKSLIVEIMGRHSNIIFVDENNKILDSAKHIDFTVSAVRQILPGLFYENPPKQEKFSPSFYSLPELLKRLEQYPDDSFLDKFLVASIDGMSPLFARELVYRFCSDAKTTCGTVDAAAFLTHTDGVLKQICQNEYRPSLVIDPVSKKPFAFSCILLTHYQNAGVVREESSISEAIDQYYELRSKQEHIKQRTAHLVKLVRNNIERCEKKYGLHQENLIKSQNREQYKIYGDLLTANLYMLKPGLQEISVSNYYSETQETVTIPLKEELSPSQNAQRYYKLYTKAKMTEKYASSQAEQAKEEKYYLESVLNSLETIESVAEFAEIREELADGGYLPKTNSKTKKKSQKSKPLSFVSSDGFEILVGRNNKQNDELTIRMAYSTDLWFHTKVIPGSHTIIRTQGGKPVPERTILEAAQLAAYYSKAQNSSKVPVDYTQIKNVKKPNGAKPGMVIYDHYNTLYVEPALLQS